MTNHEFKNQIEKAQTLRTELFKLITEHGINHVLCVIEGYADSQQSSALRSGDYKVARQWQQIDQAVFTARKLAMLSEL